MFCSYVVEAKRSKDNQRNGLKTQGETREKILSLLNTFHIISHELDTLKICGHKFSPTLTTNKTTALEQQTIAIFSSLCIAFVHA